MKTNSAPPPLPVIFWIIWIAIFVGVIVIYLTLGRRAGEGIAQDSLVLRYAPLAPFIVSVFIRWFLLLKATAARQALVLFVLGLALAESCALFGIFLLPEMKHVYLVLSLVGISQYAPFFSSQFAR